MDREAKAHFFEQQRPRLLRLAYGLLGSRAEAEDVVQDAYIRFELADAAQLENREGWLTTVVTRIAIDRLRSASHQREVYPGTWLPEPLVELRSQEQKEITRSELSIALLFLLEQLAPAERAVFLLRAAFEIPYREVARIVDRPETACRQIYIRARRRVEGERGAAAPDFAAKRKMVDRYATAILEEDERKLIEAVTEDVIFFSDGGGKVPVNVNPIVGVDRLLRFARGLGRKYGPESFSRMQVVVNGEPGLLVFLNGRADTVTAFRFDESRISAIYGIRNPDKLMRLPLKCQAEVQGAQSSVEVFTLQLNPPPAK
ncbi:MAG: RNA polymerase sigma factor SigJ [Bryobacteraceae bacterium]